MPQVELLLLRRSTPRSRRLRARRVAASLQRRVAAARSPRGGTPHDRRHDRRPRRPPAPRRSTTKADPEGARHQGRRRHGPEDQARAQALPARPRPQGRPASPARPRSPRSASRGPHRPTARSTPRRRRADAATRPGQDRPVRVRRRHRPPSRANGRYRGKYQFSQATWEALGGTGDPAEAEARRTRCRSSTAARHGPWPACSASSERSRSPTGRVASTTRPFWVISTRHAAATRRTGPSAAASLASARRLGRADRLAVASSNSRICARSASLTPPQRLRRLAHPQHAPARRRDALAGPW